MDPQTAVDAPRISIGTNYDPVAFVVHAEEGVPPDVLAGLRQKGHVVKSVAGYARGMFGRGQIIARSQDPDCDVAVWSAGSDPRGDGAAVGY